MVVPEYQRLYKWVPACVLMLLCDIDRSIRSNDKTYPLGAPIIMARISESEGEKALRADLLDGQNRFETLIFVYGVLSAYILDLQPGNAVALALARRLVRTVSAQHKVSPADGENLLTLQEERASAGERTQQSYQLEMVLPLFGSGGPATLRALLTTVEPGALSTNIVACYKWMEALAGVHLSGLPEGFPHQVPTPDGELPPKLRGLTGVQRLLALLHHLENHVVMSPQLLNLDLLASASHRIFAAHNSSLTGLSLSDTELMLTYIYIKALGAKSLKQLPAQDRKVLSSWHQWTNSFDSEYSFEYMLNAMRWVHQASLADGDVSGRRLAGAELLNYFLGSPQEGRPVYAWLEFEGGPPVEKHAHTDAILFVRHCKKWKEAFQRLKIFKDSKVGGPAVVSALEVLKCAGGTKLGAAAAAEEEEEEAQLELGRTATCAGLLATALAFHLRPSTTAAAFAKVLGRVEALVAALRLAKPMINGQHGKNHLRDKRRLARLALVGAVLRRQDPAELSEEHPALVASLTLHAACPDGASPKRLAHALLHAPLYYKEPSKGGGSETEGNGCRQRCLFVLAATEAAAHRRAMGADLSEVRTCSTIEHILPQSFAKPGDAHDRWVEDGWVTEEGAPVLHLLGNLVLLPMLGEVNELYLNQLLGAKHYTEKRETLRKMYKGAYPLLTMTHLFTAEKWTPAAFLARHLDLAVTLALRWGVGPAMRDELRAAAEAARMAGAPPAARLFEAHRLAAAEASLRDTDMLLDVANLISQALAPEGGAAGGSARGGAHAPPAKRPRIAIPPPPAPQPAATAAVAAAAEAAEAAAEALCLAAAAPRLAAAAPTAPRAVAPVQASPSQGAAAPHLSPALTEFLARLPCQKLKQIYDALGGKAALPMASQGRPSAQAYRDVVTASLTPQRIAELLGQHEAAERNAAAEGSPAAAAGAAGPVPRSLQFSFQATAAASPPPPPPPPPPPKRLAKGGAAGGGGARGQGGGGGSGGKKRSKASGAMKGRWEEKETAALLALSAEFTASTGHVKWAQLLPAGIERGLLASFRTKEMCMQQLRRKRRAGYAPEAPA